MTKVFKKTDAESVNPFTAGMGSMEALHPIRESAMKVWLDLGADLMQFMSSRMKTDMEMQQELLGCKGLEDVQNVQAKFFNQAFEDYNAEATRMMKIMSAAMPQGSGGLMSSRKPVYDNVPL